MTYKGPVTPHYPIGPRTYNERGRGHFGGHLFLAILFGNIGLVFWSQRAGVELFD